MPCLGEWSIDISLIIEMVTLRTGTKSPSRRSEPSEAFLIQASSFLLDYSKKKNYENVVLIAKLKLK